MNPLAGWLSPWNLSSAYRCLPVQPHGRTWLWGSLEPRIGPRTSWYRFQKSISLSSSLGAPIVCHIYLPSLLFVSKWKKKCQDSISSLPSEYWKGAPATEWQMVFEWYTEPLPLGLLWRRCFWIVAYKSGKLLCDMWLFHNNFNYFACFQTMVAAFFNFNTHWIVTQAFSVVGFFLFF